ncbi:MAG: hypothetical protein M3340_10325 [Actinomycetota bacterium]|nr:hypothetical protein [Actinomycetota bacterium]
MALQQYTECIEPSRYRRRSFWDMSAMAAAVTAAFASLAVAKPWCMLFAIPIFPLVLTIVYCRNWLYERLICLGGDVSVVGAAISVSEPKGILEWPPDWDNDYSVNLLLKGTEFGVLPEVAWESEYGELIAPHGAITALGSEVPQYEKKGILARDEATATESAALHCEFEGDGNYQLLQICQGALGFAIAAVLACVFLPTPADLVVAIGLSALAILLALIGAILAKLVNPGSPSDVNPDIPTIHTNSGPGENGQGEGADVLYIEGTWVFDPLHEGWNEIHPIKVCTIVGEPGGWDGDWSTQPAPDVILRIQQAFEVARAPGTQTAQARPEHQWQVHPELDACTRVVIE